MSGLLGLGSTDEVSNLLSSMQSPTDAANSANPTTSPLLGSSVDTSGGAGSGLAALHTAITQHMAAAEEENQKRLQQETPSGGQGESGGGSNA